MNDGLFYKDKPLFGLDIGFSSVKVMQIKNHKGKRTVAGYGVARFDKDAIKEGEIVNPENIAKSLHELFSKQLIGDITTHRTAVAIPAAKTFSRTVELPEVNDKELAEAVRMEAEQYIPIALEDLYIDYEIISRKDKKVELLVAATPRKIVDSYLTLARLVNLDVVCIETTISSSSRLFLQAEASEVPTVIIDFGSISSDITIFDKKLVVTGTVMGGGDNFTEFISKKLGVNIQEAGIIKTKYGLGLSKKQKEITECMSPVLEQLIKEIRRMIRYYEERLGTQNKIGQIVTMGGGANMPGLSDYLTNSLRIPVRMCDPWQKLNFSGLQPPNSTEKSMYITAAGLALLNPREIYT